MWASLCRCFRFCWLKRNFHRNSHHNGSILFICLFFYLTFLTAYSSQVQSFSHKHRHHGHNRSNSVNSIRTKRQHSYDDDPYHSYSHGGYSDPRRDSYPDSYVLDEEGQREGESGPWDEWSRPSECSRSCGGGVSTQTRQCRDRRPDGTQSCTGAASRYFSCNIQDCPGGAGDFRAEQCATFNDVPFEGRKYDWIPYTKAPNKCELNCMPRGERFYYRHKRKVTDGTRCDDENHNICVDGKCMSVGCDMKLGSTAREDKCRTCGGDGSNCNTVTGVFEQNNMQVGYNDILLIPAGATNINVRERQPSNNYLAIRNVTGHYYLNGNWRIDFPSEIPFAGTIFHYERKPHSFILAPESIRALGPITEALYIVILYQESNPGILYEYSIPQGIVVSDTDEYLWVYGEFGECDAACGGGRQNRRVSCARRSTRQEVDPNLCDPTNMPPFEQNCNNDPCPTRWYIGGWEHCDAPCGENGTQLRRVFCEQTVSGGSTVVEDSKCEEEAGPMPERMRDCSGGSECPTWFVGEWLPCDHLCGDGQQKRTVKCHTHENDKVVIHDESKCRQERPEESQPCFLQPCEGVDWVTSPWSGCEDNCGATHQTREVHCSTAKGKIEDEEFCHSYRKPNETEECEEVKPCEFAWYASQWSKCTSKCGSGIQTRLVFCGETKADGSIVKADESKCDTENKYDALQNCTGNAADCKGIWTVGPWSKCSKECGGGQRNRQVICKVGNETADVSKCDDSNILFGLEDCNKHSCGPDEIMTVMPTTVVEEDYEDCDEDTTDATNEVDEDSVGASELMTGSTDSSATMETSDDGSGSGFSDATTFDLGMTTEDRFGSTDELDTGKPTDTTSSSVTGDTSITGSETASGETSIESSTISMSSMGLGSSMSSSESRMTSVAYDSSSLSPSSPSSDSMSSSAGDVSSTSMSFSISVSGITETSTGGTTDDYYSDVQYDAIKRSGSTDMTSMGTTADAQMDVSGSVGSSSEPMTSSAPSSDPATTMSDVSSSPSSSDSTSSDDTTATSDSTTESTSDMTSSTDTSESTSDIITSTPPSSDSTKSDVDSTVADVGSTTLEASSSSSMAVDTTFTSEAPTTTGTTTEGEYPDLPEAILSSDSTDYPDSTSTDDDLKISSTTEESLSSLASDDSTTLSDLSTVSDATGVSEASSASISTDSMSTDITSVSSDGVTDMSSTDETSPTEMTGSTVTEASTESVSGTTGTAVTGGTTDYYDDVTPEDEIYRSTLFDLFSSSTSGPGITLDMAISTEMRVSQCKPRKPKVNCTGTSFGCCPNNIDVASGPFGQGCKIYKTCKDTKFGCCPDGVSIAQSKKGKGCPKPDCKKTLFGCCPDGKHSARGNDNEGCDEQKENCEDSEYGCCPDGETAASGPKKAGCIAKEDLLCAESKFGCCPEGKKAAKGDNYKGCKEIDRSNCTASFFGCCSDGKTAALGLRQEGCPEACLSTPYKCCQDGRTAAHGPNKEGCCLNTRFGCCPDNILGARGPNFEGCGCQYSPHGCCPDNETAARGPGMEGCGCRFTEHGCCPDGYTDAPAPNYEGCPCQSFQFGCCPDGVAVAKGPNKDGCGCQYTQYQCCPDQRTPASGPNQENCGCEASRYGCCPDGITEASGQDFEGCEDVPIKPGDVCGLDKERGSCRNFTVKWFFDMEYGGCSRFWYGGCDGNNNRFATQDECKAVCVEPEGRDACYLPRVAGPCEGYYPSWYYDPQRERCEQFIYGGCLGNNNRFQSRELCENTCLLPDHIDACDQPKTEGPCRGNYSRWSFDKDSESCRQFQYGGCKGNNNNFLTERECHQRCKEEGRVRAKLEQCMFPVEPGLCKGDLVRWYYDENIKTCLKFLYGGCGGNPNRFVSRQECLNICSRMDPDLVVPESDLTNQVCFLPKTEGPCGEKLARWHYDTNEQRCVPFYYSGCQGNANRFQSLDECERTCPKALLAENACILPESLGDCASYTERYHYNAYEGRCKAFVYSGCGGNANNFLNVDECRNKCERLHVPKPTPVFHERHCFLEPNAGPCEENSQKWYYDSRDGVCRTFRYGGCEGNLNRFDDRQDCEDKCARSQDICQLPQVVGPCHGDFPQWFYEAETDSCSSFVYGGCEGNGNRFDSQTQCEQRCKKDLSEPVQPDEYEPYSPERPYQPPEHDHRPEETTTTVAAPYRPPDYPDSDICRLGVDSGRCRDNREPVTAWYFDAYAGRCSAFAYSGCEGNANRFETEEQCERQCGQFKGQDVCRMRADIGPCGGRFPKWYFDQGDQTCRQFYYGGCDGNGNRFTNQEECESVCFSRAEILPVNNTISGAAICRLSVDIGPCNEGLTRWYYDPEQRTCIPFAYGGCAGNLNRFKNFNICYDFCNQFLARENRQQDNHDRQPEVSDPRDRDTHPRTHEHDNHDNDHRQPDDRQPERETLHSPEDSHRPEAAERERPDCTRERHECETLRCPYGVERYVADGGAGCTVCRCVDPCREENCPEGTQCSVDVHNGPHGTVDGPVVRAVCRRVNKPGYCPNLAPSRAGNCDQECQSDADCSADMKCCFNGCGSSCLVPLDHDSNAITGDIVEPVASSDPGGRGARIVGGSQDVEAEEGSLAALECVAVGQPDPSISWRKGSEKISVDAGRFRMLPDGTLQIIGVWKSDGGVYTCIADNGLGRPAQHSVRLNVTEAAQRQAVVVEDSPTFVVSLGASANLRCFAVGWPRPTVTWWRGDRMLPFSSERYEQMRDYSLLIRLVSLRDLGPYTCQAYNGLGKAASWTVTLQSVGPVHTTHPDDQAYLKYLISQPQAPVQPSRPRPPPRIPPAVVVDDRITFPTTTTTSTARPHIDENEIVVPNYLVPLQTTINLEKTIFAVGSEVSIPCEVEGYPTPQVLWYHDEHSVPGEDPRARVLGDNTLVIANATTQDSGTYRCDAVNEYGAATTSVVIQVEGVFLHPNCTDNPFFANCKLIVKASYCTNRYYARFCCKSCTIAGQLPSFGPHIQEYEQAYFRRPPTSFVNRRQRV